MRSGDGETDPEHRRAGVGSPGWDAAAPQPGRAVRALARRPRAGNRSANKITLPKPIPTSRFPPTASARPARTACFPSTRSAPRARTSATSCARTSRRGRSERRCCWAPTTSRSRSAVGAVLRLQRRHDDRHDQRRRPVRVAVGDSAGGQRRAACGTTLLNGVKLSQQQASRRVPPAPAPAPAGPAPAASPRRRPCRSRRHRRCPRRRPGADAAAPAPAVLPAAARRRAACSAFVPPPVPTPARPTPPSGTSAVTSPVEAAEKEEEWREATESGLKPGRRLPLARTRADLGLSGPRRRRAARRARRRRGDAPSAATQALFAQLATIYGVEQAGGAEPRA